MEQYSKAIGTGIGGAAGAIVVWVVNTYLVAAPLPDTVAAAVVTLVAAIATYFAPRNVYAEEVSEG